MEGFHLVVGTAECPINVISSILSKNCIITENWSTLARDLEIPSDRIRDFRQDKLLGKITFSDLIYEVLELWTGIKGNDATLRLLLHVLENDCEVNAVGESLRLRFNLPCKEFEANNPLLNWKNLSLAFQKRVSENLKTFFPEVEFGELLPNLGTVELFNLMTGKKPPLFKNTIPGKPSYYVERTLVTTNVISSNIFQGNFPDILLFTGIDRSELSRFALTKLTSSSREQLCETGSVTVGLIILDQMSHFEKICGKTTKPVHLIEKGRDQKLRWARSVRGIGCLQRYLDSIQDELDEEVFLTKLDCKKKMAILISDSPGMGKSVLLSNIGIGLQNTCDRFVIFLVFTDFVRQVKKLKIQNQLQAITKVLQITACENLVGRHVLQSCLFSQEGAITIELLLDGFDELDSGDNELATEILKTINNSMKSIRLWVTSRAHFISHLEETLNGLSYKIRTFCETDQITFLSSFWSQNALLEKVKLKQFAHECLKSLKSKINSTDQDIAGIPLQCLLIGEVYQEDAVDYALSNGEGKLSLQVEIGTVTTLYTLLIKKKIQKCLSSNVKFDLCEEEVMLFHALLSIDIFFPELTEQLKLSTHIVKCEELLKVGLLESSSTTQFRFLHRTFAEYFIARFLADRFKSNSYQNYTCHNFCTSLLTKVLLSRVLECQNAILSNEYPYSFKYSVICYFLNCLLSEYNLKVIPIFKNLQEDLCKFSLEIAYACVKENLIHVFKFLDRLNVFDDQSSEIFSIDLLQHSIKYSNVELVKAVLNRFELHHEFSPEVSTTVLRTAAKSGLFSTLEFLLKEKQLYVILQERNDNTRMLIHDCVALTHNNPEIEIQEKIQKLPMLVRINPSLLNEKNAMGRPPLLSTYVHVDLLLQLIESGANVMDVDELGNTLLHFNGGRALLSAQEYHKLLLAIPDNFLRKLVHVESRSCNTTLTVTPLVTLLEKN